MCRRAVAAGRTKIPAEEVRRKRRRLAARLRKRIGFVVPAMNESEQSANAPANDAEGRTPQVMQSGAGNVDKIRDILFGTQMRDYDTRFSRLEETVAKETAEIRDSSRRRLDQLEQYIKREFEALELRIKAEREERAEAGSQSSRELKE